MKKLYWIACGKYRKLEKPFRKSLGFFYYLQ